MTVNTTRLMIALLVTFGAQSALASGITCQTNLWTADCMPLESINQSDARISIICEDTRLDDNGGMETFDIEFLDSSLSFTTLDGPESDALLRSVEERCGGDPTYAIEGCLVAGDWKIQEGTINGYFVGSVTVEGDNACPDSAGDVEAREPSGCATTPSSGHMPVPVALLVLLVALSRRRRHN